MSKVKRKTITLKILLFILLTVFAQCCKNETPIPEEKFIKIYVDLLFIQDTTTADKSLDSLKQIVFSNHEITEEMYMKTIKFYDENPDKWEMFFDKAIAYAEKLKSGENE